MIDLNLVTSIPAVLVLALVARGFIPFSSRAATEELRLFSNGMLWMIGAFMLRIFYWGTVRGTVLAIDPDLWRFWSEIVDGPDHINAMFNVGFMVGGVYILRGFHVMIPADERSKWSIISAPFYPGGWCARRLARTLSQRWRQR